MTKYIGHSGPKTLACIFAYGGVFDRTCMDMCREIGYAAQLNTQCQLRDDIKPVTKDIEKYLDELEAKFGTVDEIKKIRDRYAALKQLASQENQWELQLASPPQDALIDRARSMTAQHFLKQTDAEVIIMIDHDISWHTPIQSYEGDLCHLARVSVEENAIVGGIVSKKTRGQGFASLLKEPCELTLGEPKLYPCWFVGSALTAYPRKVVQAVYDSMDDVAPGFRPIFLPMIVPHPHAETAPFKFLHLSEDWSFCARARALNIDSYISSKPLVAHFGLHPYTVIGDACQAPPQANNEEIKNILAANVTLDQAFPPTQLMYSLLHATRGRPEEAKKAHRMWMDRASLKDRIEYIFSIDDEDTLSSELLDYARQNGIRTIVGPSRGCVDAYNRAAYISTGKILIQVHDDLEPPLTWDVAIGSKIPGIENEFIMHVDDGLPVEVNNNPELITILIGSRAWFKKCGYFWNPDFISIYCDDHMSELARKHNAIVVAKDIKFKHNWKGANKDDTTRRSYQQKNWEHGKRMLELHRGAGFPMNPEMWKGS